MTELINRPEYLNQLIQNRDVDLVKIVTAGILSFLLLGTAFHTPLIPCLPPFFACHALSLE